MTGAGGSRGVSQLTQEERRALFERLKGQRQSGAAPGLERIPRRPPGAGPAPLSFAQERLWFLQQLEPGSTVHNMPAVLRLTGEIRPDLLDAALRAVAERHEVLRTRFPAGSPAEWGEPVQEVVPVPGRILLEVDLRGLPADRREPERDRAAVASVLPFSLQGEPLFRAALLRTADREADLFLDQHHAVSDGWSLAVLVREVVESYAAAREGRPPALPPMPPIPLQYADYAAWQRAALTGERLEEELKVWRERLAGVPPLRLPADRPPRLPASSRGGIVTVILPAAEQAAAEAYGRSRGATLFITALAAFNALLARHAEQDDFAVGTVAANRDRQEIAGLIGFFVSTLALRAGLGGDPPFDEVLARAKLTALEAFAHQALPFEKLVAELRPDRGDSLRARTPLFQVMLILQNAPEGVLEAPGLRIAPGQALRGRPVELEQTWSLRPVPEGLELTVEYARDLYDEATAERMAGAFRRLLAGAVSDPARRLSELPLSAPAEERQILADWSRGRALKAGEPLLHRLIEARAAAAPDAPAVEADGLRTTYAELEARANRLARFLRRIGVGPEARVGVVAERTPAAVAGLFAVLKAGGAYVPLDPDYPAERLAWMASDAGLTALLAPSGSPPPGLLAGVLTVPLDGSSDWLAESPAPPDWPPPDPRNAAYGIYTSGSTGRPKGVIVEHRSIAGYIRAAVASYVIRPDDRVLQLASLSFDTSVEEIFMTLAAGACLVLRTPGMAGAAAPFLAEAERLRLTVLDLPTAYWHELARGIAAGGLALPPCLRLVIVGGEEAHAERLADWREGAGSAVRLLNSYGPTEATIAVTEADLTADLTADLAAVRPADFVPIGSPLDGACTYVISRSLIPAPIGVPGELAVGGSGVARGYLGRPELTAERFVPDPWSGEPGARLYRTGDRARWRSGGLLEYRGRADGQVKVRGYRVEPGEVAAALERHPDVAAAVVVPWTPAGMPEAPLGLAAYAVPAPRGETGSGLTGESLRRWLAERLPPPLVPAAVALIPALPLTPGGKVDRRRLPAPDRQAAAAFVPPGSGTERALAAIWAEMLGLERVGADDNLFELGGHSLLLPRIQARIRERLGRDVPLLELFAHPTVRTLAAELDRVEGAPGGAAGPGPGSRDRAGRQRQGLEAQRQRMSGMSGRKAR